MKLAMNQPYFFPRPGYFAMIKKVDIFCFMNFPQIGNRSFVNRNKIKKNNEVKWITIPIEKKFKNNSIENIFFNKLDLMKLYSKVFDYYKGSRYFNEVRFFLEKNLSTFNDRINLADFNCKTIKSISHKLGINTKFINLDKKYIKNNSIDDHSSSEIMKKTFLSFNTKEVYNFFTGVEKRIPPFDNGNFFEKNEIHLYQQNYILNESNTITQNFNLSILDILFHYRHEDVLKLIEKNDNYKLINF